MVEKTQEVDAWNVEKTVHSLIDVANAMKVAKELQERMPKVTLESEEERNDAFLVSAIIGHLSAALYDLTKITAYFYKLDAWAVNDRDRISEGGDHGLVDILRKYNLADWIPRHLSNLGPEEVTDESVISTIFRRVQDLARGPAENRTLIYDELMKLPKNRTAGKLLDMVEPVTQGEKSWTTFQKEVDDLFHNLW